LTKHSLRQNLRRGLRCLIFNVLSGFCCSSRLVVVVAGYLYGAHKNKSHYAPVSYMNKNVLVAVEILPVRCLLDAVLPADCSRAHPVVHANIYLYVCFVTAECRRPPAPIFGPWGGGRPVCPCLDPPVGRRIADITDNSRETTFLFQRLSVAL